MAPVCVRRKVGLGGPSSRVQLLPRPPAAAAPPPPLALEPFGGGGGFERLEVSQSGSSSPRPLATCARRGR